MLVRFEGIQILIWKFQAQAFPVSFVLRFFAQNLKTCYGTSRRRFELWQERCLLSKVSTFLCAFYHIPNLDISKESARIVSIPNFLFPFRISENSF